MIRRCVMSQVRRLATVSSHKTCLNRTPLTTYRSHMIPAVFNQQQQLLVSRCFSTASHGGGIGKDFIQPPASSFSFKVSEALDSCSSFVDIDSLLEWMKRVSDPQVIKFLGVLVTIRYTIKIGKWLKKKYDYQKHVKEDESIDGCLKYEIIGFKGAYDKSITAEIWNSRYLVVSGRSYNSYGWSKVIERQITLPNNEYAEAKKRAKFYPDAGLVVVEISDFKKVQDINIEIDERKKRLMC